jgi:hypothetical protein
LDAPGQIDGLGFGRRGFGEILKETLISHCLRGKTADRRRGGLGIGHRPIPLIALGRRRDAVLTPHTRTRNIYGSIEIHDEGNRLAGRQGQIDIFPVILPGILHHGPALNLSIPVIPDHQAIAGFPDRDFPHVGDAHSTPSFSHKTQGQDFLVLLTIIRYHRQRRIQFGPNGRIKEAKGPNIFQQNLAKTVRCGQIEHGNLLCRSFGNLSAVFDTHNSPFHGRRAFDAHLLASSPIQKPGQRGIVGNIQGKAPENAADGVF